MKTELILRQAQLFAGIDEASRESMLRCLDAKVTRLEKGQVALLAGERPEHVGIVLSGQLHIVKEDHGGNRVLVAAILPGDIYAEALCCAGVRESPVTVLADTEASVMLLRFERILQTCPHTCVFHTKLIENMIRLIAGKNLMMQSRLDIIATRSIREKVLRYLHSFAPGQGKAVTVPLNREEMADYLCVERSALSHELSRMKKDRLIDYQKNLFTLLS